MYSQLWQLWILVENCDESVKFTRAAAYTQINHFEEAINDCLKSIEIDPNYSKAYSRLGFAYYAQGKYRDAIDKGFIKGWFGIDLNTLYYSK